MNDLFQEYMSRRLNEIDLSKLKREPGPVVTISRAAGCSVQKLAHRLAEQASVFDRLNTWTVISKEILHQSAEELKLHPDMVRSVFEAKDRSFFDDLMQAFLSAEYQMERKMKNTVINVIHRFAIEGHKIIMGRAGNIICSDIPNSLHIRIDAPFEWKLERVMHMKELNKDDATEFINQIERNRQNFIRSIKGRISHCDDYDLVINQAKFTNDQITEMILEAMKYHHLFKK